MATDVDLLAKIAAMNPRERRAFAAMLLGDQSATTEVTPKMQPAIAEIPDDQIDACLSALAKCAKAQTGENPAAETAKALIVMAEEFPGLVAAMQTNSAYRRKPIGHSINACIQVLTMRKGA